MASPFTLLKGTNENIFLLLFLNSCLCFHFPFRQFSSSFTQTPSKKPPINLFFPSTIQSINPQIIQFHPNQHLLVPNFKTLVTKMQILPTYDSIIEPDYLQIGS
ncbi:hypothetical protein QVD17_21095 [Tagetes erecta]|uniref:Uncharacterized protein n=1 Tax=Tagetes erecta TaxID=13708 RepID=A0AAD8KU01_TARER|nr:hypothetical protein QVD17_21095 [Tagetes erecta]